MIIGNGNSFRDMLMNSPGTCPNCNASLTFGEAADTLKSTLKWISQQTGSEGGKVFRKYMVSAGLPRHGGGIFGKRCIARSGGHRVKFAFEDDHIFLMLAGFGIDLPPDDIHSRQVHQPQ